MGLAPVDADPAARSVLGLGVGTERALQRAALGARSWGCGKRGVHGGCKELSPFVLRAGICLILTRNKK